MEKWEFVTTRRSGPDFTAWEWEWRRISPDNTSVRSSRSFTSFTACVADARKNGFTGNAEPSGTFFRKPERSFAWT